MIAAVVYPGLKNGMVWHAYGTQSIQFVRDEAPAHIAAVRVDIATTECDDRKSIWRVRV
jgi:hypothetical protein